MAYDLQEQEQLEALRAWWKQNAKIVIAALAALALGFSGMQGWRTYRHNQALQASQLYGELQDAMTQGDLKKVRDAADAAMGQFPSSAYATMAALLSAGAHYASGDAKTAVAQLHWVIENAGEEEARDIARLRLAGLFLDEKNYAEALKLIEEKHAAAFDARYADVRGDILAAQAKTAEARQAYQDALGKISEKSEYRKLVQDKLDALGDAK